MIFAVALIYVGTALWYAASPATPAQLQPARLHPSPALLRSGGSLALALGVGSAVATAPYGTAVLVCAAGFMAAASLLVIAAPLLRRFLPLSSGLAAAVAVAAFVARWL